MVASLSWQLVSAGTRCATASVLDPRPSCQLDTGLSLSFFRAIIPRFRISLHPDVETFEGVIKWYQECLFSSLASLKSVKKPHQGYSHTSGTLSTGVFPRISSSEFRNSGLCVRPRILTPDTLHIPQQTVNPTLFPHQVLQQKQATPFNRADVQLLPDDEEAEVWTPLIDHVLAPMVGDAAWLTVTQAGAAAGHAAAVASAKVSIGARVQALWMKVVQCYKDRPFLYIRVMYDFRAMSVCAPRTSQKN